MCAPEQPDASLLRACALDVLSSVRESSVRGLNTEQLFVDAITFYRWYLTYVKDAEDLDIYAKLFELSCPCLRDKQDYGLNEALFITWFVRDGYHRRPLLRESEGIASSEK